MKVRTLMSVSGSILLILATLFIFVYALPAHATYHFANYSAHPPLHIYATTGKNPVGMMPADIKRIYNLPARGGSGTIVIVGAYNDTSIVKDLSDFSTALTLPSCTTSNGCFSQHLMARGMKDSSSGWDLETALDVEWAHAIAPTAKILLVEAATPSGTNLLKAIDYAASVPDARAISLSWGGAEFGEETTLDSHFKSVSGAQFFVSSGDSGAEYRGQPHHRMS